MFSAQYNINYFTFSNSVVYYNWLIVHNMHIFDIVLYIIRCDSFCQHIIYKAHIYVLRKQKNYHDDTFDCCIDFLFITLKNDIKCNWIKK